MNILTGVATTTTTSAMTTLDHVKQLTTLDELETNWLQVEQQKHLLVKALGEQQQQYVVLASVLDQLSDLKTNIDDLYGNTGELAEDMHKAVEKGQAQMESVHKLDEEQRKIKQSIQQLHDIKELQDCITGTLECLSLKDYDKAAVHLYRSTKLSSVLDSHLAHLAMPIGREDESPKDVLNQARVELRRIIQDEFAEAVRNYNQEAIRRFFKLFPMIGEDTLGLILYADFLCSLISDRCKEHQTDRSGPKSTQVKLTELYEMIAMIIDHHYPLVETNYGPGRMLYIIYRIQREVDTQASILLDSFHEEYKVDQLLANIEQEMKQRKLPSVKSAFEFVSGKSASNTPAVSVTNDTSIDLRQLDRFLKELTTMSQKTEIYRRFIIGRAKTELETLAEDEIEQRADLQEASLALDTTGLLQNSRLTSSMTTLLRHYLQVERYFARKSVTKVLQMDEANDTDKTSTSLEDVFFILKNCCRRAITLCHVNSGVPALKLLVRIIEVDYLRILHQQLDMTTSQLDPKDARRGHMICLNNMEVSCEYMSKLASELQDTLTSLENMYTTDDFEVMTRTLDILPVLEKKTRTILEESVEEYFEQHLQNKLYTLVQRLFKPTRYLLTEISYEEQELNDNTASRFIAEVEALLAPYYNTLTTTNWSIVYRLVSCSIIEALESILYNARINQLGALQVDKDIRALSSFFINKRPIKCPIVNERVERLNEINMLLTLDDIDDLKEMMDPESNQQLCERLSAHEIRRTLSLRVDFSKDKIAQLSL